MAYTTFIPKIEWLKDTVTGTTAIGSGNVSAVSALDIAKLQVGMFIEGAGIPAGTLVTVIGVDNFDISTLATAAGTPTLDSGFRIEFDFPPAKDPLGEDTKFVGSITTAKSGKMQTIEDYMERSNKITFSLVSQSIKDTFDNFLTTHMLKGLSFSYFEDKSEPLSELIVEKDAAYRSPRYGIITRKRGGKDFLWKFSLQFRRLI